MLNSVSAPTETCAAEQASLEAQLAALQGSASEKDAEKNVDKQPRRRPKREALPEHLPRVDQRIEPKDTHCPTPECGQPMVRVGEDISERLDIIPAQFFVQRQIRGKWACRCCQLLVQEPAAPQIFANALPTPGLQAHTVVSRFVDHIPYYRQEQINARAVVHTPRSTLAGWSGQTGAQLMPLYEALRAFVLGSRVVHASIGFAMDAMLGRHADQLKMPRPDAYGQRAAIVMSLEQSANFNEHDPWAYLRDVLERLFRHPNSRIERLLPRRWTKPAV